MGRTTDNDEGGNEQWGKVPPFVSALVAVGGIIAAYFYTVSDFRVKDTELTGKVQYLEMRTQRIEDRVTVIEQNATRRVNAVDNETQALKQEIDNLKEVLRETRGLYSGGRQK